MSWILRQFLRSPPLMDPEPESNSESPTNGENGLPHTSALPLYLFIGITPIVLFLILPFVEKHYNKRRRREEAKRRLTATKLAEPIREAYLLNLMKGYSMVLSNSDICDENRDEGEEELSFEGKARIENSGETISASPCNSIESSDMDDNDNLPVNDDIEMQQPKTQTSEENEEEEYNAADTNSLECDNSQCHCRSFYIPTPGQSVGASPNEKDNEAIPRKAHSDGCVICFNPFEVGQHVSWSSNPECPHVFHHQCLLEWFAAVGTKTWTTEAVHHLESDVATIQGEICKFPKLCPFCRRDYFLEEKQESVTENESNTDDDDGNSSYTSTIPANTSSLDSNDEDLV